ncbi:hypothetical protein NX029_12010 [Cytobacillus firmus]|nr:hypothetical protein [Cytobacillus firmus]
MHQVSSFQLEEYAGQKFFVEYVDSLPLGSWFRIHMSNGVIHNMTTGCYDSIEKARQEVIKAFKEFLDGSINTADIHIGN